MNANKVVGDKKKKKKKSNAEVKEQGLFWNREVVKGYHCSNQFRNHDKDDLTQVWSETLDFVMC